MNLQPFLAFGWSTFAATFTQRLMANQAELMFLQDESLNVEKDEA